MMRPLDEFANLCSTVDAALSGLGFSREGHTPRWRSDRDGRSWTARFSRDRRTRYAGEVRTRSTLGYRLRIGRRFPAATRVAFAAGLVRDAHRHRCSTRF